MKGQYYENDHGDMKQSMIVEFADVLGTTVEYLICGVIKVPELDADSVELLKLFGAMDEKTKQIMRLTSELYSLADFLEVRYETAKVYEFYMKGLLGGTVFE